MNGLKRGIMPQHRVNKKGVKMYLNERNLKRVKIVSDLAGRILLQSDKIILEMSEEELDEAINKSIEISRKIANKISEAIEGY